MNFLTTILPFVPFVLLAVVIIAVIASGYVKAPPDTAYIISGFHKEPRILIGKAGIKIPFFERLDTLTLRQMSIDIKTNGYIPTKDFIGVNIDAVAKVRVLTENDLKDEEKGITSEMVAAAMKNFLNMSKEQIEQSLQDSLQGNMREIIGTQELKQLCNDRKAFGDEVQAKAQKDMNALGIWIESCNIQKLEDEKNLITALGQDNMAQISKNAAIAKSNAEREVAIAEAQNSKAANDAKVAAAEQIAVRNNEFEIKQADLKKSADTRKAQADAAKAIEDEKQRQVKDVAATEADIARQEKQIELKEREVAIKERALEAEVKKTAEAEKYAVQQRADAKLYETQKKSEAELFERTKQAEAALAEAQRDSEAKKALADAVKAQGEADAAATKAKGEAEAAAIRAKLEAEAEGLQKKAEAMKNYQDAAVINMKLETLKLYFEQLPAIAEAVGKGYTNVDKIMMFGGDTSKLAGDIMTNVTQVSEGLSESLGIDVKSLLAGVLGTKAVESFKETDTDTNE